MFLIGQGHVLDILEHPNQQRYGGQRIFVVVQRDDDVYLVPLVEDDKLIALKTTIPTRDLTPNPSPRTTAIRANPAPSASRIVIEPLRGTSRICFPRVLPTQS